MKKIISTLISYSIIFLFVTACNNTNNPQNTPDVVANSEIQRDHHTLSNSNAVQVNHLNLDIKVDFDAKKITGSAQWLFDIKDTQATEIILDTYDLNIDSVVNSNGNKLNFTLKNKNQILGSALIIPIQQNDKEVTVFYSTNDNATALQWLTPLQTFGKEKPFLYTQSESIYARTWIPCQDGPGIRFTYNAKVTVPKGLLALMSATNPQKKNNEGVYTFEMNKPIPAYLMALAVGDLSFQPISNRSGVYAEPNILAKASKELEDLEQMIKIAEGLYGTYPWGRYDVVFLPSGFPLGGMENPLLTFATPTILAGDKSLVNLIAHELAHSWSGNLVTNATWNDFWLNEGFTVYFERRITEAMYGKDYTDMLWTLGYEDLKHTVEDLKTQNSDYTKLKLYLKGKDPDIGLTDIAYEKGSAFLLLIEQNVGRKTMDSFLIQYFNTHAFTTINTENFLTFLDDNLLNNLPEVKNKLNIGEWVYESGIPNNYPQINNVKFAKVDKEIEEFKNSEKVQNIQSGNWSTYEWLYFLRNIKPFADSTIMSHLDKKYDLTNSTNSEIACIWFQLAVSTKYMPAFSAMRSFLNTTGRMKFLEPIYIALKNEDFASNLSLEIYLESKNNYHPLAQKSIEGILGLKL